MKFLRTVMLSNSDRPSVENLEKLVFSMSNPPPDDDDWGEFASAPADSPLLGDSAPAAPDSSIPASPPGQKTPAELLQTSKKTSSPGVGGSKTATSPPQPQQKYSDLLNLNETSAPPPPAPSSGTTTAGPRHQTPVSSSSSKAASPAGPPSSATSSVDLLLGDPKKPSPADKKQKKKNRVAEKAAASAQAMKTSGAVDASKANLEASVKKSPQVAEELDHGRGRGGQERGAPPPSGGERGGSASSSVDLLDMFDRQQNEDQKQLDELFGAPDQTAIRAKKFDDQEPPTFGRKNSTGAGSGRRSEEARLPEGAPASPVVASAKSKSSKKSRQKAADADSELAAASQNKPPQSSPTAGISGISGPSASSRSTPLVPDVVLEDHDKHTITVFYKGEKQIVTWYADAGMSRSDIKECILCACDAIIDGGFVLREMGSKATGPTPRAEDPPNPLFVATTK